MNKKIIQFVDLLTQIYKVILQPIKGSKFHKDSTMGIREGGFHHLRNNDKWVLKPTWEI